MAKTFESDEERFSNWIDENKYSSMYALDTIYIYNIKSEIPLFIPKNIVYLNISGCDVVNTDFLLGMANIELLNVTRSNITNMSDICKLSTLIKLHINNNKIEEIPESILNLQLLREFDARNNNIHTIDKNIGKLKKMSQLDLTNNNIIELPESMLELTELKQLFISDNPIAGDYLNIREKFKNITNIF